MADSTGKTRAGARTAEASVETALKASEGLASASTTSADAQSRCTTAAHPSGEALATPRSSTTAAALAGFATGAGDSGFSTRKGTRRTDPEAEASAAEAITGPSMADDAAEVSAAEAGEATAERVGASMTARESASADRKGAKRAHHASGTRARTIAGRMGLESLSRWTRLS